jgi:uncharacterized damage-inducible protein DinB
MNKETQSIIRNLENTLSGQPWFGRAVFEILKEVDESKVNIKPNSTEHSLLELLWHMNTWAEFVLASLENRPAAEMKAIEELDWRTPDPAIHTWKNGIDALQSTHKKITGLLSAKDDSLLGEMVPTRQFNYRFMLNGLIHHNIYHLGQVAYVKKLLAGS